MTAGPDAAALRYPHVVTPLRLGHVTLRNRIARPPHGTGLAEGVVSDDLITFHQRRAAGGVGLVLLGDGIVHPSASGVLHLWDPAVVPGMRALAEAVHGAGAAVVQQLNHQGAAAIDVSRPWSASAIPLALTGRPPVPMDVAMIADVTDGFVAAARNCHEAGLDGVEVHAGHGFLVGQFLSPLTNDRTDAYGGSAMACSRFLVEILTAIRERVPGPFLLGVRFSVSENLAGGLEADDTIEVAVRLERDGLVDFVDLSTGHLTSYPTIIGGMHEPHGYQLAESAKVSAELSVPTIATGRVHTLAEAEEALASGFADMIGMARPTIADPDLVAKSLAGRELDVIPCIACNECISTRGRLDRRLVCTTNPTVGDEHDLTPLERSGSPRRIVVVGGGPAGLEAARVAAIRGHDVVLFEAREVLGGAAHVASLAPYRSDVGSLVSWLSRQVDALGVDVRLGQRVVAGDVAALDPHIVVAATGARPAPTGCRSPSLAADRTGSQPTTSSIRSLCWSTRAAVRRRRSSLTTEAPTTRSPSPKRWRVVARRSASSRASPRSAVSSARCSNAVPPSVGCATAASSSVRMHCSRPCTRARSRSVRSSASHRWRWRPSWS